MPGKAVDRGPVSADVAERDGKLPTSAGTLWGVALFSIGMIVMALAAHRPELAAVKWLGAAAAAFGAAWAVARAAMPLELLGLRRPMSGLVSDGVLLAVLAVAMAAWYRAAQDRPIVPETLTIWAAVAASIGLMEEIGYRGLMQGVLTRWCGAFWGIALAASAHTAYKLSLVILPNGPLQTDLVWLAGGTLALGVLLGFVRWRRGNLLPACLFHVAFDIAAYGDLPTLPWWSW